MTRWPGGWTGALPGPEERPLFYRLDGGQLSDRYVRDLLKRLAAKAGIDKRVYRTASGTPTRTSCAGQALTW